LSILVDLGISTYWPECVEELVQSLNKSKEDIYFAVLIFANVHKELFDLNITSKQQLRIQDLLTEKKDLIKEFIQELLCDKLAIQSTDHGEIQAHSHIFNEAMKLFQAWVKFGVNVLETPLISRQMVNFLNAENAKYIADVFIDSLTMSPRSKLSSSKEIYSIDQLLTLETTEAHVEMQSIENLIELIKSILQSYGQFSPEINNQQKIERKLSHDEDEIVNCLANILSSILENFIHLLFAKNSLSQTLIQLFFYFISSKKRKFSYKFFETMNEIREFINRGYKFNNFDDSEKVEFCNFLLRITENVMSNCRLPSMKMIVDIGSVKDHINIEDISSLTHPDNMGSGVDKEELEAFNITLKDYRTGAEDLFYNIFLIFTHNFHEDGATYFFERIGTILKELNIEMGSNTQITEEKLIIVEVVMLTVKSILDTFEVTQLSPKFILNFCLSILNSQAIENEKIVLSFIIFLEQAAAYVNGDLTLLFKVFEFLLRILLNVKNLEKMSAMVLLTVSDFFKVPNIECFNVVNEIYQTNFDTFQNETISNLSEILCNSIAVYSNEEKKLVQTNEETIITYFKMVLKPAAERIRKVFELLSNHQISVEGENLIKVRNELLKNYSIFYLVLKKSTFLNSKIVLLSMWELYMHEIGNVITPEVFKLFAKIDPFLIREVAKMYTKVIPYLESDFTQYFDLTNTMLMNTYFENPENFSCLVCLKMLYSEVAKSSQEKKIIIANTFMQLCDAVLKAIMQLKKNQIEVIDIFAQLFSKVLDTVNYLVLNREAVNETLKLFQDAMANISQPDMNKSVMKALTRIFTDLHIIPKEYTQDHFANIVYTLVYSCDNYQNETINDVLILFNFIDE
jgi:hypothetical protein